MILSRLSKYSKSRFFFSTVPDSGKDQPAKKFIFAGSKNKKTDTPSENRSSTDDLKFLEPDATDVNEKRDQSKYERRDSKKPANEDQENPKGKVFDFSVNETMGSR